MADVILDPEDRQYEKHRKQLMDDFDGWLRKQGIADDGTITSDAELLVDWCSNYSTGELSRIDIADLQEFLLDWCPRKVTAPPAFARQLCKSLKPFIAYLCATGRLRGGLPAADRMAAYLRKNAGRAEAAMGDTSKFGMAKSLFAGSDPSQLFSADSVEELQELAEERMAAHNALSLEERRAATDQFFTPEPLELPFSYLPPTDDDIAESAAAAPLLATFDRLRDYLGDAGRQVTNNGNLKLADARELVDLLQTGDRIGDRRQKLRSSRDLLWLSRLIDWATAAGAVRVERGRLKPVKRWASRSATDRVERCWDHLLTAGPRFGLRADMGTLNEVQDMTETSALHWLVRILPAGDLIDFNDIVESTQEIVADETADWNDVLTSSAEHFAERDIQDCMQTLETAGVIIWRESQELPDRYGDLRRQDGTITLTPIGRHLTAGLAPEIGYRLDTVPDLGRASAPELLELLSTPPASASEIIERWQPDLPASRRAAMLAEAITSKSTAMDRMIVVSLLYELPVAAVEPAIRTWLDTPNAGYAVAYLLDHDLARTDEFDGNVSVGPFIDALSLQLDQPDQLLQQWQQAIDSSIDPVQLLDDLWRHEVPDTEPVLEALGSLIPDQRLAKLARKSLFKHRGRMANRLHR